MPMPAQSSQSASVQTTSHTDYRIAPYRVDPRDPPSAAREWVVPNGLGGFAMGTAAGTADRRYHSILTAALHPPVMRMNLVASIDDRVIIEPPDGSTADPMVVHLTPMRFMDADPGKSWCRRMEKTPTGCIWFFEIDTPAGLVLVRKELQVADGASASRVSYAIESEHRCRIEIRPLLALRDFHALNAPGTIRASDLEISSIKDGVRIARSNLALTARAHGCSPETEDSIWHNLAYTHEQDRGLDFAEDVYCPIVWRGESACSIELALDGCETIDWDANRAHKHGRIDKMISSALALAGDPSELRVRDAVAKLAAACDDFIVQRMMNNESTTSIIAGYPWFSDWGRDSMIALPGLLLVTGRTREAFEVLQTFARAQRNGLIPNRFDDRQGDAHYNTVDASLWFVHACVQYVQITNDRDGFETNLLQACTRVIEAYRNGTDYNIGVDPVDGLVAAGNAETQLTWMDAQRDGITFTPRHGKAIEINALWINALESLALMLDEKDADRAHNYRHYAETARRSVHASMTGGVGGGLVDCLTPTNNARSVSWVRSAEIRPNQVFAVSLPMVKLAEHVCASAAEAVERHLSTPVGLRTLSPSDSGYCGHYVGPLIQRDRAYHNGTVWPWLLGAHCQADMRVHSFDESSRTRTIDRVCALVDEMSAGSIGSIAEIYDAEPGPDGKHVRQGCPAQAWSIAELLRVIVVARIPATQMPGL